MTFEIKDLPYPYDTLKPLMSPETLKYHWGKHYAGYVNKLNALIRGTEFEKYTSLEEIMFRSEGAIYNNAAQAWNHQFFFSQFAFERKGHPSGEMIFAIDRVFGSYNEFVDKFKEAALSVFGSGWAWLTSDENRDLHIITTPNAINPATEEGLRPLLTIDIWEHAYYLDYQNNRGEYFDSFIKLIDWRVIEARY